MINLSGGAEWTR